MNNIVIRLETGNPVLNVWAFLADGQESMAANLLKGKVVDFSCEGDGMLMGMPTLSKCSPALAGR